MADRRPCTGSKKLNAKHWQNDKAKRNMSNKSIVKDFRDKQQRMAMKYYKQTLKEEKRQLQARSSGGNSNSNETVQGIEKLEKKMKMPAYLRAQEIYERKQKEIEERRDEKARIQKEKDEARAKYREMKMRKMNILRQKTRKGQPIMKGRIELLLEKIVKEKHK